MILTTPRLDHAPDDGAAVKPDVELSTLPASCWRII
jgi:hypothetical protein